MITFVTDYVAWENRDQQGWMRVKGNYGSSTGKAVADMVYYKVGSPGSYLYIILSRIA